MTIKELQEYKEQQKRDNAILWNKQKSIVGDCTGLTDQEYYQAMNETIKNTTRRVHSKGNLWN